MDFTLFLFISASAIAVYIIAVVKRNFGIISLSLLLNLAAIGAPWISSFSSTGFLYNSSIADGVYNISYDRGETLIHVSDGFIRVHDTFYLDYTTQLIFSSIHLAILLFTMILAFVVQGQMLENVGERRRWE